MENNLFALKQRETLGDELLRQSYDASLLVLKNVTPYLRPEDKMTSKLEQSVKDAARLIAAGLNSHVLDSKKTEPLLEASTLCRETMVMLSYCRDLHGRFINGQLCNDLIETYQFIGGEIDRHFVGSAKEEVKS